MEPELQVSPMLVYLLIYQEYERQRRRPWCWRWCLKWRAQGPGRHLQTDGCTLGMGLLSDRVASAVHVAVMMMVVQAAVAVAEMLPVLAVVQVTVGVDGDTRPSLVSLGWLILGEDAAD
ncbi:hypothetical protein NDU88_005640 [Pleurodeles waltl]|uniref:Uncharacterized protein n=1 Tax=Pleurodeles waltl TaxID=8319 RepID=A0AAV7PIN2_PLEWA|nr:hypothetical protein NDU88_005640 [Pleurodeles waltl]